MGDTEIALGMEEYIKQLTDIKIRGTSDTIKITDYVRWQIPSPGLVPGFSTINFILYIPYTITVDGTVYQGKYELMRGISYDDSNPKYDFSVITLDQKGNIKVLITEKENTDSSIENLYDR